MFGEDAQQLDVVYADFRSTQVSKGIEEEDTSEMVVAKQPRMKILRLNIFWVVLCCVDILKQNKSVSVYVSASELWTLASSLALMPCQWRRRVS